MLVELGRGLIVVALHSGFFQGAIEALELAVGPGVGGFGEAMLNAERAANAGKAMATWKPLMRLQSELYAVVR